MIASLRGRIAAIDPGSLVVETGGVGFQIRMPAREIELAGRSGDEVRLFTHMHVRENELALYGFLTQESLRLFELLLDVPGIGPRAALSLLSGLSPESLSAAIGCEDIPTLTTVPGIGPKTARNLVFHLRDKMAAIVMPPGLAAMAQADADVIAALTSLGYSVVEAQRALQTVPKDVTALEDRIRLALISSGK